VRGVTPTSIEIRGFIRGATVRALLLDRMRSRMTDFSSL